VAEILAERQPAKARPEHDHLNRFAVIHAGNVG
jgi:hypothetical protein